MQKTHCMDQEEIKTIISRMESQEVCIRNTISEELARSEIEAMERDARLALFYQDQQFNIAVREHRQQGRGRIYRKLRSR